MTNPHPPSLKGSFLRWLRSGSDRAWGTDPDDYDPEAVASSLVTVGRLFGPDRWFPLEVDGWDNVPDSPALLVMNHSGGSVIPDMWGFVASWYAHFGTGRPLHVLAHEMLFATERSGSYFARRGILRASPEQCVRALRERGRDVLVAPGGERDTWRPWSRRYEVEFAGRKGYARTAVACGVPVVPVAHVGAHHTLIVLTDGQRLARWLGFQRAFRAEVFPVHLSLPWGLAVGPWPHIPPPTTLRYRLGPALAPAPRPEDPGAHDEAVDALDRDVRGAITSMLHAFRDAGR